MRIAGGWPKPDDSMSSNITRMRCVSPGLSTGCGRSSNCDRWRRIAAMSEPDSTVVESTGNGRCGWPRTGRNGPNGTPHPIGKARDSTPCMTSIRHASNGPPVVWDVGAEEGDMPALYATWGCDVVLVEPNPKVWPCIRYHWTANQLDPPAGIYVGLVGAAPNDKADRRMDDLAALRGRSHVPGARIPPSRRLLHHRPRHHAGSAPRRVPRPGRDHR